MAVRRSAVALTLFSVVATMPLSLCAASGQDNPQHRGRKYKAPADTSHIEVLVVKKSTGRPIVNAAVVFHPINQEGKDEGNMEVKTDPEGKASIDVIPTGSTVRVQVIANGFATFAKEYVVSTASQQISVSLLKPQEQISAYEDNTGKASTRKSGVQEPVKPDTQKQPATPPKPTPAPTSNPTAPSTGTPQ